MNTKKVLQRILFGDRGSVESSMVLIPLIFLFLIATQISIAIQTRNLEQASAQSAASERAITGSFELNDTFIHIDSPDPNHNLDLLITHRKRSLSALVPGLSEILGRSPTVEVSGIAVIENQR